MPTRRTAIRWLGLISIPILCAAGIGLYSAVLAARALFATLAMSLIAQGLQDLIQYLNILLLLEIVGAFTTLATQGPIVAAVWIWSRVGFWTGQ